MDNTQKNQDFFRAIVKAALSSLFAIGIKSPEYIERFSIAFQNALEKNLALLPQPQEAIKPEVVAKNNSVEAPTSSDKSKEDISTIIKNPLLKKSLRNAGINTVDELIIKGQQSDYSTIKGVKAKSVTIILDAIKKWNS